MSNISVLNGDMLTKLKTIASSSIDLVIADPPYNLGKDYGNNNDEYGVLKNTCLFQKHGSREVDRVLKPTGTIYIFMGVQFISYMYDILKQRFKIYQFNTWICWHYTQGMGKKKGFSPTPR
jgi:DNA modification methylase